MSLSGWTGMAGDFIILLIERCKNLTFTNYFETFNLILLNAVQEYLTPWKPLGKRKTTVLLSVFVTLPLSNLFHMTLRLRPENFP